MTSNRATKSLSQKSPVLHVASLERIQEAQILMDSNAWGLSMYVSGLAVESLMQAIAIRSGASHDAHHDLRAWLKKCPQSVTDVVGKQVKTE